MTLWAVVEFAIVGSSLGASFIARRAIPVYAGPIERVTGVSIIRPCEGAEPQLAARLAVPPSAIADEVEMLACTTSTVDQAAAVARDTSARVVVDRDETAQWLNPKVRHLDAGLHAARHPIIVFADADAVVGTAELDALLVALSEPGVAGAFAAPMAAEGTAWGNRLLRAALGGSFYAWPALVSLTRALGQPLPMSGALVAFRRRDLPHGLAEASASIGDDLAIARALQGRGELRMTAVPVRCFHGAISAAQAVITLRRWVHVAVLHAPWRLLGFPLLFCASPWLLLFALIALPDASAAPFAIAFLGRLAAVASVRRRSLGDRVRVLELMLLELVLLDAALRAAAAMLTGKELAWRHRRYTLGRGGRIESVRSVPQ